MQADTYFKLYSLILNSIANEKIRNGYDLIRFLNSTPLIRDLIAEGIPNRALANDTMNILENLMDDGLVNGKITPTKSAKLYDIDGLSTLGYQFLNEEKDPSFKKKLFDILKEDGLPMTATGISKALFKLFLS